MVGLLPVGEAFVSHAIPICLTSRGVYRLPEHSLDNVRYRVQGLRFLAYEDIANIEADGKVMKVNGDVFIKFPSSTNARQMTEIIRELMRLEPATRHDKIRTFLNETTNLQETCALRENHVLWAYIKTSSSVLFIFLFVILPLALYSGLSAHMNLFIVVIILVLLYLFTLIMAYVWWKKVVRAEVSPIIFATSILSPVTTMHIIKNLSKELYTSFDYLAIAAALLPSDAFQSTMRQELLRITYAKEETGNSELMEFWNLRENSLRGLLTQKEIEEQQLLAAPKRQDPSAASYCPFCLSEYMAGTNKCSDCGIPLRNFDDSLLVRRH